MYTECDLLGAKVHPVTSGTATLKDAVIRDNERVDKPYCTIHIMYLVL